MTKTLKQLMPALAKTKIIGRVEHEGLTYKLRLNRSGNYGIRPQLLNPATGKWFFLCSWLPDSFTLAGLRDLMLEGYLSVGSVVFYDHGLEEDDDVTENA